MSGTGYCGKVISGLAEQLETHAARERAADERQFRADERDRLADERQSLADAREARADEREQLADQRERAADRREAEQDERDEQDRKASEPGQRVNTAFADLQANIELSRLLLARSGQRLNREEAAARRQQARRKRQQEEIDRASAETERGLAAWLPDSVQEIERSRRLRQQVLTAIDAFAASEAQIARLHEDLAAADPSRREEHRRIAEQARDTARKAREMLRTAASLPSH